MDVRQILPAQVSLDFYEETFMASGFVYRSWTNNNRGSSGKFLFLVSVSIAILVMFMVNKANAFVATVTVLQAGSSPILHEKETFSRPIATKAHKSHKHKRQMSGKPARKRVHKPVVSAWGHSLGSQNAETTYANIGIASWYGPGFHGRRTASGTVYDMNELTAAHKTLPFGTKLLVTHKATGKSTIVTITDRGPYVGKRVLDLSKEAARQLHLIRPGIGEVEYSVL